MRVTIVIQTPVPLFREFEVEAESVQAAEVSMQKRIDAGEFDDEEIVGAINQIRSDIDDTETSWSIGHPDEIESLRIVFSQEAKPIPTTPLEKSLETPDFSMVVGMPLPPKKR